MNQETFETTVRQFLRKKPFQPFVVELLDGNRILIEQPAVAMGGGAASMLTEDALIEFACEQVQSIRPAPAESIS